MRWLLAAVLVMLVACTGAPVTDTSDTYVEGGCCTYSCEVVPPSGQVQAYDQVDCDEIAQTQCELAGTTVADATWSPTGC